MLAASRDDTTLLWRAVMKQVLATSAAISDAMAAQGHARQAAQIRAAIVDTERQYIGRAYAPDTRSVSRVVPSHSPVSKRSAPTRKEGDLGR